MTPGRSASRPPRPCAVAPTRPRCSAAASAIGRKADELRANGVAGTPDEVAERLQSFAAIGAQSVYLQVLDLDDLDHVSLLAEEVLPRVA